MTNKNIITQENPKSPVAEAYRTLRTNIQFSNIDEDIKSIVVTSSGPGEGKSTTTVNLAVTMAQVNKRILLVDSDLRKPRIHTFFDISNTSGLTTALAEGINYKDVIQESGIENLDILSSGPIPPNPSEILGSNRMKTLLEQLKEDYDIVLLDSPPVGLVTDSAVLSSIADGTLLVCAVGQALIDAAKNAKALLEKVNANILGVVINKIPLNEGGYYKHHYYNYYNAYYAMDQTMEETAATKDKKKKR